MPPMRMDIGWSPRAMSTERATIGNDPRSSSCNVDWIHKYPRPLFMSPPFACTMSTVCKYYTVLPTAITESLVSPW